MSIYAIKPDSKPPKRRVFFSFYYQKDIWRVNQVRQSWRFQHEDSRESEGFFDASLWEKSQRTSDESLKSLIRDGLSNTSVTCVLAGSHTASRRWVKYEIAQSLVRGNGLLTVKIHNMENSKRQACIEGTNPLDVIGIYKSNGSIFIAEYNNGKWIKYPDYSLSIKTPSNWSEPIDNNVIPISYYTSCYNYVFDAGRSNFSSWINLAANSVGR